MYDFNEWGVMFLVMGGVLLALMIYVPALKAQSPFSRSSVSRQGLNELLGSYRKARNRRSAMMLSPLLILPGLFLARDNGSFFACMTVAVGGLLLFRRSYSADRGLSADYRKEAASLVTGGGKNPLGVLDKLDGEVRRGEAILRSGNDYQLYPSALVVDKGSFAVRPWVVPTDSVRYMFYAERRSEGKLFHCVFLYDEHGRAMSVAKANKKEDASALMTELKRRFGVQDETKGSSST